MMNDDGRPKWREISIPLSPLSIRPSWRERFFILFGRELHADVGVTIRWVQDCPEKTAELCIDYVQRG